MKRCNGIIAMLVLIVFMLVPMVAKAGDFDGLKEIKIVWDISIGDEKVFTDRINLIQQTADSLRKRGITPVFALGIHGPATKFVTKSLEGTKFEKDKIEKKEDIQSALLKMTESGIKIKQCSIPLKRNNITKDNIVNFVEIVDNVWETIAALQNKGYAYIIP